MTAKRSSLLCVQGLVSVARYRGSESVACVTAPCSPWSRPLAPPTPQPLLILQLCSPASSLLWPSLTSRFRTSSATAPRHPDAGQPKSAGRAQTMDCVVLLGGCDKTVPAQLMGAASADLPAIALVAGPMSTSRHRGERLGACTDCRKFWGRFRAGEVSESEIAAVEQRLSTTAGTGAVMGTGETIGERIAATPEWVDRSVIHSVDKPVRENGGLIALFGNLAPRGAILKRAAADPHLFETEGRALVFSSLEDMAARIDAPGLDVDPNDFLVLQNAGPASTSAMPEAGYIPIPSKLAKLGVKDMVRISDARMSGTAYGTIVLHVAPDSASGGPLALVRSGDRIRLRVAQRNLSLLLDDAELDRCQCALPVAKRPATSRLSVHL